MYIAPKEGNYYFEIHSVPKVIFHLGSNTIFYWNKLFGELATNKEHIKWDLSKQGKNEIMEILWVILNGCYQKNVKWVKIKVSFFWKIFYFHRRH